MHSSCIIYYIDLLKDTYLGSILFKIDFGNLSLIMNGQDIANHVDDNTPNVRVKNIG